MEIKRLLTIVLILILAFTMVACQNGDNAVEETGNNVVDTDDSSKAEEEVIDLKIGCVAATRPSVELMKEALEDTKYNVEIMVFDGNNLPAEALNAGEIDGLFCNSRQWMEAFNKENDANLSMAFPYYCSYSGLYSSKVDSVSELPEGAEIVCSNGLTNIDQALKLLKKAGLIELNDSPREGDHYSILDITENKKNIKVTPVELVTTMNSIHDVDAVVASAVIVRDSGIMSPNDYIALCDPEGITPHGLIVNKEDESSEWAKLAEEIMNTEEYYEKFNERYDGTFILEVEFEERFSEK